MTDIYVTINPSTPVVVTIGPTQISLTLNAPVDTAKKIISLSIPGTAVVGLTTAKFKFQKNVLIDKILLHGPDAPVGSSLTIDLLKNDIEQARIATLANGSKNQETTIAPLSILSSEYFSAIVKTVGSIEPGAGIEVIVFYV